jgi:branched-chain amino acid transport system ATP-binding protein
LAPLIIKEIGSIISQIKGKGLSILLAEQNANFALALADRGYILEKGQIRISATGEELRQNEEIQRKYLALEKKA